MVGKLAMFLLVLAGSAFAGESDDDVRALRAELTVVQKYSERKDAEIAALKKRVSELEQQLKGAKPGPTTSTALPATSIPAPAPVAKVAPVTTPVPLPPGQKCAGCRGVGTVPCQTCWDANRMSTGFTKCLSCGYRGRIVCPSCHGNWGGLCKMCNGTGVASGSSAHVVKCHNCIEGTHYICVKLGSRWPNIMPGCLKGYLPCKECDSRKRRDPCLACNGDKKVPCPQCGGQPAAKPPGT